MSDACCVDSLRRLAEYTASVERARDEARTERDRLADALVWYAVERRYESADGCRDFECGTDAERDGGQRARAALGAIK